MDPHKRSATIEIIDDRETVLAGGRFGTDRDGYRAMLAVDASADATAVICRVAVTAGSAGTARHREPFAPLTAAAAVTTLADRGSDLAVPALTDLSALTRSGSLHRRVTAALKTLTQPKQRAPAN
jgi:hypothetical protein